jgi:hypothetical protein
LRHAIVYLSTAFATSACAPTVDIGAWTCSGSGAPATDAGDASLNSGPDSGEPIAVPWHTGFEDGFCDYTAAQGFCFADPAASYTIVTSPVHSGRFAAAFTVTTAVDGGNQTRCVRQGILPVKAYYGAWYYVPSLRTNTAVWNLFHFLGSTPDTQKGAWDISLINEPSGPLHIVVYDFLSGVVPDAGGVPQIPIGSWFHLEIYIKRAADKTGEVAVYQDGQVALDLKNLATDDSPWGQWYVGNLANALAPPESTVYVDDVTISETLDWTPPQ